MDVRTPEALYASGRQTEAKGKVTRVEQNGRIANLEPATIVHVEAENGQTMAVYLAPASELQSKGLKLQQDNEIQVKGALVDLEGEKVLIVSDVTVDGQQYKLRDQSGKPVSDAR